MLTILALALVAPPAKGVPAKAVPAKAALVKVAPASVAPIEVPFKVAERAIIVDATVNGRTVSLMFDTGFSAWVNVNSNISLGKPTGKTTMVDFVGTSEADTVKIKSLQLGGKPVNCSSNAEAFISGNTDYSSGYNTHCDGLMGFAVIKDNITEINFEKKKFIIYPRSFDITKLPVDNKKKFLVKLSPTGAASMELPVETANGGILTLSLDTGNAFYATTFPESLERVGILKEGFKPKFIKQSGVASGAVDSYSMKMPPLKIFGVPVETSVWDIINLPSALAGFDGTVGFGFLKNFNIVIDYDRRRVHLTNWTGSTADEEEGDVGIGAAHNDRTNRTIVYGVTPDGPADKAGIKRGDFLVAVDGKEVGNVGYRRLRSLFAGPKGTKIKVSTSRGGTLRTVELERTPLINEPGS